MPARVDIEVVRKSVESLLARRTHPAFAGYLAVCEEATLKGTTQNLTPDFKGFFDKYLSVEGGPAGRPYYRPFWHQGSSKVKAWYQENVAGSYSLRSAARTPAFTSCVTVDVMAGTFSLKTRHATLALKCLALEVPLAVLDVAAFLLRDFEFPGSQVGTADLIGEFTARFAAGVPASRSPLFRMPAASKKMPDVFARS